MQTPIVCELEVDELSWNDLDTRDKTYAYHLCRAAWHGARIIMKQTSPESGDIFDFLMQLDRHCAGDWQTLADQEIITTAEVDRLLDYAGCFLSNIGNYYGTGDQKFVPAVPKDLLREVVSNTGNEELQRCFTRIDGDLYAIPPYNLGFPSDTAQSAYYIGDERLTKANNDMIVSVMRDNALFPENVRLYKGREKRGESQKTELMILQASISKDDKKVFNETDDTIVILESGDHCTQLSKVCDELVLAKNYTSNETQNGYIQRMTESFNTGDLNTYRDSLKLWLKDSHPRVESVFGFVEPYRDPAGMKAEFEGIVGIVDVAANTQVESLANQSSDIVRSLPWVHGCNWEDGIGPFEKTDFTAPVFVCMEAIAYCSSIVFPGINLPNVRITFSPSVTADTFQSQTNTLLQYNDIREHYGHKSLIVTNRMKADFGSTSIANYNPFILDSEQDEFQRCSYETYRLYVVLHELYGHPTGRLLIEDAINQDQPPLNPLTGNPVKTWYKQGQTWTTVFGDLATTLDECRCELVAAFLMDNDNLLKDWLGENDTIEPRNIMYNLYQLIGSDGLYGLVNYHPEDGSWGSAHSQGHFAMLQWLLRKGGGVVQILCDPQQRSLKVRIDESKIKSAGTPALAEMLLRMHVYRCTADVGSCRTFYRDLCSVNKESLTWYEIVTSALPPKTRFVQPNILLENGEFRLKRYSPTNEGIVQSWRERYL